jgi:hypothetical protein
MGSSPTYNNAAFCFKRVLGAAYFCAFLSLYMEVHGLLGMGGLLPISDFLRRAEVDLGERYFSVLPSLFWFNSSDAFLSFTVLAGCLLSMLYFWGVAEFFSASLLWIAYLSIVNVGQDFLSFQWDILLLESGFLAIFISSPKVRGSRAPSSPCLAFLFRWLLFRLVFMSGMVKILSGDPSWRELTALSYHYETQPLPTVEGYFAHQLPLWFQEASVLVMFLIELVAAVGILFPPRIRRLAFAPLVGLQILILITGNYTFFNILTTGLCFFLLDDEYLRARAPRWLRLAGSNESHEIRSRGRFVHVGLAAFLVTLSVIQFGGRKNFGSLWLTFARNLSGYHLVNSYGLFAIMTTEREEIILEGSADGVNWREYRFKWKPGALDERPRRVAPLQPRLDWQMWFAALGTCRQNLWFLQLMDKLLGGSEETIAMLAENPFPGGAPVMLRSSLYRYEFTDFDEWWRSGRWWKRTYTGPYCPLFARQRDPSPF